MYLKSIFPALLFILNFAPGLLAGTDCGFLEAGKNSFICPGDTVVLRIYTASDPWHWVDGATEANLGADSILVVTQPGLFIARLDNGCHEVYIMVRTIEEFAASLISSDSFCPGKPYYFNAPLSDNLGGFLWDDGSTNPERTFYQAGTYGYSISASCGQINGNFELQPKQVAHTDFPLEIAFCPGEQQLLTSPIDDPVKVTWSDGSEELYLLVTDFGTVSCEVMAPNGCQYEYETSIIEGDDCECSPKFPNVFSPNGDGINDRFIVQMPRCDLGGYVLTIYDRWGNDCFSTNNPVDGWNGGQYPDGVYYFHASYHINGLPFQSQREYGSLLLMR